MTDATHHDILDVTVGSDDPADDVPVETLRSGLQSDDGGVRLHAANVASFVPREEVETLKAVLPALIDCLDDDKRVIVYQSTIALSLVAEDEPELLEDTVPRLVELLEHDLSLARTMAAKCLGHVALDHPEYFADQVDELVAATATAPTEVIDPDHIENPDLDRAQRETLRGIEREEGVREQFAREITANLLVELAEYDPALLEPHTETLADLLSGENVPVTTAIADVVAAMAREEPAVVDDAVEPLCAVLDHVDERLVATAVSALGFIGDPAAVDPLRELADDEERDEDLRDLATETADFLEGQSSE